MKDMRIEFILFAGLARYMPEETGGKPCIVEIEEGASVGKLLERFNVPEEKKKIIFVNGVISNEDTILKDGDRAGIFPIVAGG